MSACLIQTKDTARAGHPFVENKNELVYVKANGMKGAYNIYRVGPGSIPMWCDIDDRYKDLISDEQQGTEKLVVCYSDHRPGVSAFLPTVKRSSMPKDNATKGPYFIEEQLNPFGRAYMFTLFITPSRYDDFFVFYFNLYRKFCQKQGVGCCMTGNAMDFKFSFVIEEPDDVRQLYRELEAVSSYINSEDNEYQDTDVLYSSFSSTIYDTCQFNRWYYDALSVGVVAPEKYMDKDLWSRFESRPCWGRIKRVNVKLVDYQKVLAEDKSWLNSSLRSLSDTF